MSSGRRYSLAFFFRQTALVAVLLALAKYRFDNAFSFAFAHPGIGMLVNTAIWLFLAILATTIFGAIVGGFWDCADGGGAIGMLLSSVVAPFFIGWHWWGLMNAG